ncbi:hypothetical protein MXB_3448 [Myxobolus squamalis]|nr:hypothetical protein MXB_3448 [Myxobolus squamalis]
MKSCLEKLIGFCLIKINGEPVFVKSDMKGQDVLTYLKDPNNYPLDLSFARLLPNESKCFRATHFDYIVNKH